ncbi:MAG: kynureninase [Pyrinomonadaceae bacterium]
MFEPGSEFAAGCDLADELAGFRSKFHFPEDENGRELVYFTGNSLGLQPKSTREFVDRELEDWKRLAVEGHESARHPWMPYHEFLTEKMARVVGALPIETVVMNALTVNLHLLFVSFYRPSKERFKILIEADAFPSDRYAVESQIKFHGFDPSEALVLVGAREGEDTVRGEDVLEAIETHGESLALVFLGGVNYLTGQFFPVGEITAAAHQTGALAGFDLAHAAGNVPLELHDWNVDFAAWCSYKYLNSGPGGVAGAFVHERHKEDFSLPRFAGWWGHEKTTRFLMGPEYVPIPGAEGWQLSNPPILQMAALMASLDVFDEAGMLRLREKSEKLTGYLEWLVGNVGSERISIVTPKEPERRGCQLSIRVSGADKNLFHALRKRNIIADWRQPDIIRVAPVPLYNSFSDCHRFYEALSDELSK